MSSRPTNEWTNKELKQAIKNEEREHNNNVRREKWDRANQNRRHQENANAQYNADMNAQNQFNEEAEKERRDREDWEAARNNNESDPAIKTISSSAGTTRGQLNMAMRQFPPTRTQRSMPNINRNNGEKTFLTNPRTGEKQFISGAYLRDEEAEPKRVFKKRLKNAIKLFEKTNKLTRREAAIKILEYGGYPKIAKRLSVDEIKEIRKKLAKDLGISLDLNQEWVNSDGVRKITVRNEEEREVFVPSKKLQEIMNKIKPNNNASASAPATNNKPVAKKTAAKNAADKRAAARKKAANKAVARKTAAKKPASLPQFTNEEMKQMKQRNTDAKKKEQREKAINRLARKLLKDGTHHEKNQISKRTGPSYREAVKQYREAVKQYKKAEKKAKANKKKAKANANKAKAKANKPAAKKAANNSTTNGTNSNSNWDSNNNASAKSANKKPTTQNAGSKKKKATKKKATKKKATKKKATKKKATKKKATKKKATKKKKSTTTKKKATKKKKSTTTKKKVQKGGFFESLFSIFF